MAFTKTIVVAVVVAVIAQLAAAGCSCGCGSSGSSGAVYTGDSDYSSGSGSSGAVYTGDSDYAGSSSGTISVGSGSYGSSSYGSGSSDSYSSGGSGSSVSYSSGDSDSYRSGSSGSRSAASDSWTSIPSNAIITSSSQNGDSCVCNEIRMPDEAAPAVGIIQSRPVCAQHLSYDIEVPAAQAQAVHVPSFHSVSLQVPVRAKTLTRSYGALPYSVEVPVVQNQECRKLNNMNVEIAVPVRQRVVDTRMHSSYSVEVPAEERVCTRLTNLRANVDRIVMPATETCLPPNSGPADVEQVHYVAVPSTSVAACVSPVSLLGLGKSTGSFNYGVSRGSFSSGSGRGSGSSSGSGSSRGCACPCD